MGPTWAVSGEAGWQRWRCLAAIAFATGMLHCHGASEDASSSGGGGRAQGGAPSTGAGGHAGVCEGSGFVVDPVALVGCDSNGPGNEDCHYRVVTDASKCCAEKPCDRLVVHWAGGEQGCKAGKYDEPVLQQYASRGFVAVCAQPFTTADEAGKYPYVAEFERMHRLMQSIRDKVKPVWNGNDLAIAGTSHGATAPLVVVANKQAFKQHADVWRGNSHTAVLLFDGISNPKTLEEWAASQGPGSLCASYHQRWVGRYGDGKPLLHSCDNNACYCSNPAHASDWANDTVVLGATAPASPYSCNDITAAADDTLFYFASCDGAPNAKACGIVGDIIPDEQQQLAYQALKDCPGITANYKKYPGCFHIQCGGFAANKPCGGDDAIAWLEAHGW